MKSHRSFILCGILAPLVFIFTAILGGALRPGYSHLTNTVSELFTIGAPNRLLLTTMHTSFALLLTLFGVGILQTARANNPPSKPGMIGAALYTAMGAVSILTATVFPQDPWGSAPTFRGQLHIQLSGLVGLLTIIAMVFIALWFKRDRRHPWYPAYTAGTIAAVILATGIFILSVDGPYMGLAERLSALVGFQWTMVLAIVLIDRTKGRP